MEQQKQDNIKEIVNTLQSATSKLGEMADLALVSNRSIRVVTSRPIKQEVEYIVRTWPLEASLIDWLNECGKEGLIYCFNESNKFYFIKLKDQVLIIVEDK